MHARDLHAGTFTSFTAPAFHVEGKAPRVPAPLFRQGLGGEELADGVEELGVGGRVAPGAAADGFLVHGDALDHVLYMGLSQHVHDQGRLAGPRNAGHHVQAVD